MSDHDHELDPLERELGPRLRRDLHAIAEMVDERWTGAGPVTLMLQARRDGRRHRGWWLGLGAAAVGAAMIAAAAIAREAEPGPVTDRPTPISASTTAGPTTMTAPAIMSERPIARDDRVLTEIDTPVLVDLLGNDSDLDSDVLTLVDVAGATNGTAILRPNGSAEFTPTPGFVGTGGFTYTITDGTGTATAEVVVKVVSPNRAPTALPDVMSAASTVAVVAPVLSNDTDPDGDLLVVISVVVTSGLGTASFSGGNVTYTPLATMAEPSTDVITYTISDGRGATATSTLTILVTPD